MSYAVTQYAGQGSGAAPVNCDTYSRCRVEVKYVHQNVNMQNSEYTVDPNYFWILQEYFPITRTGFWPKCRLDRRFDDFQFILGCASSHVNVETTEA